ncbi:MAG: pitrilysin family protein [Nitrospirae bacterium]|nr:pitrilysin family protein [Nitrospirota bacterium]MDA1304023.1 pitrilysin family protein [Nitrospirota bacterium]
MKIFQLHLLVIALATVGLLATPALSQVERVEQLPYPPLPEIKVPEPTRVVLDNGMIVLLLEDHELPIVSVSARIRTGARLEPIEKIGLAGLTGTVMRSGGTTTRAGDALDDYLEGKAASIETGISTTAGSASMNCLIDDFEEVVQVFVDVLRNPSFAPEKLAIAKNQIMAGIARQNDNPDGIVKREFTKLVYGKDSPYAAQETYATIGSITREDLIAWHQKYYHPNRVILGLVGDFKTADALALVKRVFGQWPKGPEFTDPEVPFQTSTEAGVYYVEKNDMTQAKIIIGHMGLIRMHPDYHPMVITNQILSGSFGARLFSRIRSKKGLAYDVHGGVGFGWDYPESANFSMSTKTETTQAGIDALIEEADKIMKTDPPTDEEVQNAKASLLNSFVFSVDSPGKVLGNFLTYEYYSYPSDWMTRFRHGIERVTTDQVRRATQQHIKPDQFVILVVGPRKGTASALARYKKVHELDISIPES